jgi:hypothetical protein
MATVHSLVKKITNKTINDCKYLDNIYNQIIKANDQELNYHDIIGRSILHYICDKKINIKYQELFVELLIEKKIDVDLQDSDGRTALHYAVYNKNVNITRLLIFNGKADLNIQDLKGFSPLHINYIHKNYYDIQEERNLITLMLINSGCDVNLKTINGENILFYFLMFLSDINDYKNIGLEDQIIDLLLYKKCDINMQNNSNDTALMHCCSFDSSHRYMRYLDKILKSGYDLSLVNTDKQNILMCLLNKKEKYIETYHIFTALVNAGADVNHITLDNENILHYLFRRFEYTDKCFLDFILKIKNINIVHKLNQQNTEKQTPLHLLFNKRMYHVINYYLYRMQNANERNKSNRNNIRNLVYDLILKYDKIDILLVDNNNVTFFQLALLYNFDDNKKLLNKCIEKYNKLLLNTTDKLNFRLEERLFDNITKYLYEK